MTQAERRLFLIQSLKGEREEYRTLPIPRDEAGQRRLLRSLMNVRAPGAIDGGFLRVQDEYLRQELAEDGITDAEGLEPIRDGLCLWQGDITRLRCGAIVGGPQKRQVRDCQTAITVGFPAGGGIVELLGVRRLPAMPIVFRADKPAQVDRLRRLLIGRDE